VSDWHKGMICAFDVESTGVDVENDRIVTACVALVDGSGKEEPDVKEWLAWPGMDIPEEAAKVHGITTAHAREHGEPAPEVIDEVATWLIRAAGDLIPIVAFNACYDLTMLDRDSRRNGLGPFGPAFEEARGLVIDPLVMDKALDPYRKGKRTLSDVAAHYGVRQDTAHSASGDAVTAARVAWAIASRKPHVAAMTATELMSWQAAERRKQARSYADYLRRQGTPKVIDESWPWTPLAEQAVA